MNKFFRKTVAAVLSVVIALSSGAVSAFAASSDGVCGENLEWSYDSENGILGITGSGEMQDYLANQTPWYNVRLQIKTVNISDGVESVGNNAFSCCVSLESVNLPESVADIGINAFRDCEALDELMIPEETVSVGAFAFYASGLDKVDIPASVESIGVNAFGWCADLEKITVSADNGRYSSDENGVLFNKNKTELLKFPNNCAVSGYSVPGSVEKIADDAFENCHLLKTVSIPANVAEIGRGVFFNCSLENIIVSADNDHYSNDAYGVLFNKDKSELISYPSCSKETEYYIPETVEVIADGAFRNASNLKGVVLPDGISAVGDYAFLYCENLEYVHISSDITVIGEEIADYTAAYICSDSADSHAKEYADENGYEFRLCTAHGEGRKILAYGTCGDSAKWVLYADGELVVSGTGAVSDFGENGAPWSEYTDSIKKLTVENGITHIGENAFRGLSSLAETVMPESVESIGVSAFEGCDSMKKATFDGSLEDWCDIGFGNEYSNPDSFASELFVDGKLLENIALPECVKEIGDYAFAGNTNATKIDFANATSIGDGAFIGCAVETVIIPETVEKIGECAFAGCDKLEFIHIPSSVTAIGADVIPDGAYICSDSAEAYAKTYAESNGYEFMLCDNHNKINISFAENEIDIKVGSTYRPDVKVTPADTPVKWCTDNASVAYVDENGTVSAISAGEALITVETLDGTVSATCKVNVSLRDFVVSWVSDGTEIYSDTVTEGGLIPKHTDPVKTGYTFLGWTPGIPASMPATDLVFVANWRVNSYVASFDANGGSWQDGSAEKNYSVDFGRRIPVPESPARNGYFFLKWTPEPDVMDSVDGKKFVAVWAADSHIQYTVRTYVMQTDGRYKATVEKFAAETDSTVTAEYSVESGFVLNEEKSVLSGVVAADGSLVLEVFIDRSKYPVTVNGETNEYLYGETIPAPETPDAPEGHSFVGWTDENGIVVEFPLVAGEDVPAVIIPHFGKLSYTVTWVVDGVSTVQTYEYMQTIVLPQNPEKRGYTFRCWMPEVPDSMPAGDLTFEAMFDKNLYVCSDCGDVFDDEDVFNEHLAYEYERKTMKVEIARNPKEAVIKYGETLCLTAKVTGKLDVEVCWFVDGVEKGRGETFMLYFLSGTKTVEVKLLDSEGETLTDERGNEISDSQKVTVKAGFFQKLISFFKNLFRLNRTVNQNFFAAKW
ncbi:MAG: leucine-rich repeat protein [Clostridia bacterium]|nr:leucine-rich repeat protein [Clostridia bacterium]